MLKIFFLLIFTISNTLTQPQTQLTEKQLFKIYVLDLSTPADKEEIFQIIFGKEKKQKIGKDRLQALMYKFLMDQSYERIKSIKKKQRRGVYMNEKEEDVLVNTHLIDRYIVKILSKNRNFGRKIGLKRVLPYLGKQRFEEFMMIHHQEIMKHLGDDIFSDPFSSDAEVPMDALEYKIRLDL